MLGSVLKFQFTRLGFAQFCETYRVGRIGLLRRNLVKERGIR